MRFHSVCFRPMFFSLQFHVYRRRIIRNRFLFLLFLSLPLSRKFIFFWSFSVKEKLRFPIHLKFNIRPIFPIRFDSIQCSSLVPLTFSLLISVHFDIPLVLMGQTNTSNNHWICKPIQNNFRQKREKKKTVSNYLGRDKRFLSRSLCICVCITIRNLRIRIVFFRIEHFFTHEKTEKKRLFIKR